MARERRRERISSLMKDVLGKMIQEDFEVGTGELITITNVELSEDLLESNVFVSIIPESKSQEIFKRLIKGTYNFQHKINRAFRTRPIPKIIFKLDTTEGEAQRIYQLLKEAKEE